MRRICLVAMLGLLWMVGPLWAAEPGRPTWLALAADPDVAPAPEARRSEGWLSRLMQLAQAEEKAEVKAVAKKEVVVEKAPAGDGPPLPLHTIEGVGGALTVPMAYLVNPGPPGTTIGLPSASATALFVGKKNVQSFAISQTFFRRIEISYAFNRFDLGTLPKAIVKAGLRVRRQEVYLHHFNIRGLLVEENSFGLPLPAVVAGVQFKVNGGIMGMDDSTNGVLTGLGLERRNGVDFTLHMSKMFPKLLLGRPLILTFGLRNSSASNIGYTGFSDTCETTIEVDVVTLVTDRLAVGYEYRMKENPYNKARGILNDEDDWHAIRAAYIINDHCTIAGAWGYMGPVGNTFGNCAWGLQFKYEF